MNYATTAKQTRPAALLGALGVPAAFGALMAVGLTVTVVLEEKDEDLTSFDVTVRPQVLPPPPPDPTPQKSQTKQAAPPVETTSNTVIIAPDSPINLGGDTPLDGLPGLDGIDLGTGPIDFGIEVAPAAPLPDPIAASPRGNPGGWITERDYRPRWVREGLSGSASFSLEISERGRVSECTITRSSGHSVLDQATCSLLKDRARFNPAKDSAGQSVAGTFSSTVNWQLPD